MIVFWIYPVKCSMLSSVFSPLSVSLSSLLSSSCFFLFHLFSFQCCFLFEAGSPYVVQASLELALCLSVCVGWCCSRRRLSRNRVILTGFFSSALLLVSTRNVRLAATLSRPGRWPCVLHVLHGFSNEIISI